VNALVVLEDGRWLRIVEDVVAARGSSVADAPPIADGDVVAAVVAGRDTAIRWSLLPGLSDPQANAAARLAATESAIGPASGLHVVAGLPDADGRRAVVTIDAQRITERLVDLAALGLDPDHLIAAPLMLPLPETGFVRGTLGAETVLRGSETAFADDPALTPLLTAGAEITTLDRDALEAAIIAALIAPEADLRTGIFAKRRKWGVPADNLRRIAMLALALGLIVLATQLIAILRLNATAGVIERDSQASAAAILPSGTTVTDAALQAEARLATVEGAGGGFSPLAAAVAQAISATPGTELGAMVFDGEGALRATVRAASAADLAQVETRLAAAGLHPEASPIVSAQGRPYRDISVRAR
jgi:general secretion pathway protein L